MTFLKPTLIMLDMALNWTLSALECFDLKQNCDNCTMKKIYGYEANRDKRMYIREGVGAYTPCFMYQAVEKLLNSKGEPTEDLRKHIGTNFKKFNSAKRA